MTILCTGYEPFDDHETNPSEQVATALDGAEIAGHHVVGAVLPVEFGRVTDEITSFIEAHDPDAIVGLGLAAGRAAITVERLGINVNDCVGTPDNADAEPRHEQIESAGADAYFATIPVREAVSDLLAAGIPARLSNTAGTHCCNHLLYAARSHVETEGMAVPVGFVHLPATPGLAARIGLNGDAESGGEVPASMGLELQETAVRRVLETVVG